MLPGVLGVYVWLKLASYLILNEYEGWVEVVTKGRYMHKGEYILLGLHTMSFLSPLGQQQQKDIYGILWKYIKASLPISIWEVMWVDIEEE